MALGVGAKGRLEPHDQVRDVGLDTVGPVVAEDLVVGWVGEGGGVYGFDRVR